MKKLTLFVVGELGVPTCKRSDCDIVENPEHWVSVELSKEAKEILADVEDRMLTLEDAEEATPADVRARKELQRLMKAAEGKQ